jgi:8-oxo-dGTP diphosphatase
MAKSITRPVTPQLAADIIIELTDRPGRPIVLIERLYPPYGWAIPGGFVDVGETIEAAAIREAKEETSLNVTLKTLLGCYSRPDRDARGHTASLVYIAEAQGQPQAQDDAKDFVICTLDELPQTLAFDHAKIIADYKRLTQGGSFSQINLG